MFYLKSILVLAGSLIVISGSCALAQNMSATRGDGRHGVLHVLSLAIISDPASPYLHRYADNPATAALSVTMRISAHSAETNFFGNVRAAVSDFDLKKGSPERDVWKDAKCHSERGFPKITVLKVDGSVAAGQTRTLLNARYREIGRMLPSDEVMPSKRLDSGNDKRGPFIATQTETKQSRLFVDLRLHILPCDLISGALISGLNPH